MNLVRQARAENLISNDFGVSELYKVKIIILILIYFVKLYKK